MTNDYARSVEIEAERKAHERVAYRQASDLWHLFMETGTITWSPLVADGKPTDGYLVRDVSAETKVRTCPIEIIYRLILENEGLLANGRYVLHATAGYEYVTIGVVRWFKSTSRAFQVARERGEKEIYSLRYGAFMAA